MTTGRASERAARISRARADREAVAAAAQLFTAGRSEGQLELIAEQRKRR